MMIRSLWLDITIISADHLVPHVMSFGHVTPCVQTLHVQHAAQLCHHLPCSSRWGLSCSHASGCHPRLGEHKCLLPTISLRPTHLHFPVSVHASLSHFPPQATSHTPCGPAWTRPGMHVSHAAWACQTNRGWLGAHAWVGALGQLGTCLTPSAS